MKVQTPICWQSRALLVAASVYGLIANISLGYEVVSQETLTQMVGADHWIDAEVDARNVCADLNARTIGSLRIGNATKVQHLDRAFVLQLIGIGGLVLTLGWEFKSRMF